VHSHEVSNLEKSWELILGTTKYVKVLPDDFIQTAITVKQELF